MIDLTASFPLILLFGPVMLVLSLLIRLTMGKPILFRQRRPGLNSKPFTIYKFRTMSDAVDSKDVLLPDSQRITRVGRVLRETSLDELPELFNVLKGDMSLVGPRPLLMNYLQLYTREQARRHEMRPGMTGPCAIVGRNLLSWEERFAQDIAYVSNWSLALDVKILVGTVRAVLRREGINQRDDLPSELYMGPSHDSASTAGDNR